MSLKKVDLQLLGGRLYKQQYYFVFSKFDTNSQYPNVECGPNLNCMMYMYTITPSLYTYQHHLVCVRCRCSHLTSLFLCKNLTSLSAATTWAATPELDGFRWRPARRRLWSSCSIRSLSFSFSLSFAFFISTAEGPVAILHRQHKWLQESGYCLYSS